MDDIKLLGSTLLLYGEKNGQSLPLCGSRSCTLTINVDIKQATKSPQSTWQSNYYGMQNYSIDSSGMCVLNDDKFTHRDILNLIINRQSLNWIMRSKQNSQEFYSGTVLINPFKLTADMGDMELFDFTGIGDGPILVENPFKIYLLGGSIINSVLGDDNKLLGRLETGGLAPIIDQC